MQEPGSIIASYLLGEQEGTREMERMKSGQEASCGIQEEQGQRVGEKRKVSNHVNQSRNKHQIDFSHASSFPLSNS